MSANGISSELSAHQMAPAGAIAHSRAHLCPHASSLSFSSLVSPLWPLGSGLLGRGDPRYFICCYVVTDAGPASHRVRLWQGGPASTYYRFRWYCFFFAVDVLLRVLVFPDFVYWLFLKFACAPALSGGRGEMAMAVASSARLAFFRGAVCASTPYTRHSPFWSLYSDGPLSSRPQPLGRGGDVAPCEDTREDLGLSL